VKVEVRLRKTSYDRVPEMPHPHHSAVYKQERQHKTKASSVPYVQCGRGILSIEDPIVVLFVASE